MKRAIWLIVFAVLVFGAFVIARLPASWALPGPKSGIACADIDGTVWSGTCTGLTANGQAIGDVTWDVHAARLLAAKLNATLDLTRPTGTAHGVVEMGFNKTITAREVKADLPLDPTLLPQLPPNLRATLHADLALLQVEGQVIKVVQGKIEADNLTEGVGQDMTSLGNYTLTFPPSSADGDPVGQLRDAGGPLAVEGTLRLTSEPGFDLQGLVTARPTAPADLAQQIKFLGSPDAQGRRPFALAGSF
jgi:general secretion pathway protein N